MSQDKEIERIKMAKIEQMLQHAMAASKPEGKPITLTDANFNSTVAKHGLMVVDFWAPWCGPCRMVGPIIEELAGDYAGKVAFGKLNVDENPVTAGTFGVQSIPTLLIFKDGRLVDSMVGAAPKAYLEAKFKPHM